MSLILLCPWCDQIHDEHRPAVPEPPRVVTVPEAAVVRELERLRDDRRPEGAE